MSILFISASFFGYAAHIKKELEKRHGRVYWYEDRPSVSFLGKVKSRLLPRLSEKLAYSYFKNIADSNKDNGITEVFVIKGEALSVDAIKYLRATFPSAIFRLYFWDGYKNMPPSSPAKVDLFDVCMSFDLEDVKSDPRLSYRPLFFLPDYIEQDPVQNADIDLIFVGTVHSDRYRVVKKVEQALEGSHSRFYKALYFPSKLIFLARRIFDRDFWSIKEQDLIFSPLKSKGISELMARSRAVLDIERSVQTGFTMRTLEVLGSRNKLITTNQNVTQADFYNPQNILVIDRDLPVIPKGFFDTPKISVSPEIIARYTLSAWIDDIFLARPSVVKTMGNKTQ